MSGVPLSRPLHQQWHNVAVIMKEHYVLVLGEDNDV